MSYNRNTDTLRGPAVLQIGDTYIRTAGDIKTSIGVKTFDVPSSEKKKADERVDQIILSLSFRPVGIIDAAQVALLWPHLSKHAGQSLLGADDVACALLPKYGGESISIPSVFVRKMPSINIQSTGTTIGDVTFEAILGKDTEWADAAARYVYTAALAAPSLPALVATLIPSNAARIAWGDGAPWNAIKSGEGVLIDFDLATKDDVVDEDGLVDVWFQSLTPRAKITSPRGLTIKNLLDSMLLQGEGAGRGVSIMSLAKTLTVQSCRAGGLSVSIPKAVLKDLPLAHGLVTRNIGDIELVGNETDTDPVTISIVE